MSSDNSSLTSINCTIVLAIDFQHMENSHSIVPNVKTKTVLIVKLPVHIFWTQLWTAELVYCHEKEWNVKRLLQFLLPEQANHYVGVLPKETSQPEYTFTASKTGKISESGWAKGFFTECIQFSWGSSKIGLSHSLYLVKTPFVFFLNMDDGDRLYFLYWWKKETLCFLLIGEGNLF